jgi:thymidylate synthase ThyX
MLDHNVAPEQARGVLTNSLEVTWTWTGSLAFFYRVFGLRSESHAQAENQEITAPFDAKLSELFPVSWQALRFGRL